MKSKADYFCRHLHLAIDQLAQRMEGDLGDISKETSDGIVTFRFTDGSYVDFTEPLAFEKK